MKSAPTSTVFNRSLLGAEDRFSTTLFPLSIEGGGRTSTNAEVLAHLAALSSVVMLPTAWGGEALRIGDLVPSSELSSFDSLTMIGSLVTTFRASGVLEEASALEGIDVLKAAEREPPDTDNKANEGAGVQSEGRIDDIGVAAWKMTWATSSTDILARKAARVSLRFSQDKVKFLRNLILFTGMSEAEKEMKNLSELSIAKKKKYKRKF